MVLPDRNPPTATSAADTRAWAPPPSGPNARWKLSRVLETRSDRPILVLSAIPRIFEAMPSVWVRTRGSSPANLRPKFSIASPRPSLPNLSAVSAAAIVTFETATPSRPRTPVPFVSSVASSVPMERKRSRIASMAAVAPGRPATPGSLETSSERTARCWAASSSRWRRRAEAALRTSAPASWRRWGTVTGPSEPWRAANRAFCSGVRSERPIAFSRSSSLLVRRRSRASFDRVARPRVPVTVASARFALASKEPSEIVP